MIEVVLIPEHQEITRWIRDPERFGLKPRFGTNFRFLLSKHQYAAGSSSEVPEAF